MPHQLKRIVAINIRNTNGGLPSGRIAELSPRGGVLAVGDNAVGKTTFLRLLPLFYGATPTQILRGTGLATMIGYTLPDASSAVAYEYSRENASDLRCVVMHAKPGEEAPQFHIITGGFREDFFYDENGQFVTREEFNDRVRAMGFDVSRKLFLHQYRSVILNERLPTKEGADLRALAAKHSLGPAPLYNLEQIAAAMANERISFRDLQSIVIERVSDATPENSAHNNMRELKQNREAVSRWIEARNHLGDIMARRPDADKLKERISKVKGLHLELCTLHVAVKQAVAQVVTELQALDKKQELLKAEFGTDHAKLSAQIAEKSTAKVTADDEWAQKRNKVRESEQRLEHFEGINANQLDAEQESEEALKSQKLTVGRELDELEAATGGLSLKASDQKASIASQFAKDTESINERRLGLVRSTKHRVQVLRETESNALAVLEAPPRLAEIAASRMDLVSHLGELRTLIANPRATGETLEEQRLAIADVERLREGLSTAGEQVASANALLNTATRNSNSALEKVRRLETDSETLATILRELDAQLSPPAGSLLEFLRGTDAKLWSDSAKVIEPGLLGRTDLNPTLIEDRNELFGRDQLTEHVTLGAVNLSLQNVAPPQWVDMKDLRDQIDQKRRDEQTLVAELGECRDAAKRLAKELKQADGKLGEARAAQSLASTALANARSKQQRYSQVVEQEARDSASRYRTESNEQTSQLQRLQDEEQEIVRSRTSETERIRADFGEQQQSLEAEEAAAERRLDAEALEASARRDKSMQQVDADISSELAGMGIDPRRMLQLKKEAHGIAERLVAISRSRHEVDAWRDFKRDILPSMETQRRERDRLKERCEQLNAALSNLRVEVDNLDGRAKSAFANIESNRNTKRSERARLNEMIEGGLRDFIGHVPAQLEVDWSVPALTAAVGAKQKDLASQAEAMQRDTRELRGEFLKHDNPVSNWLDLKEKDLPDKQILLDHEYLCAKAQVICDWFDPQECGPYIHQMHQEMNGFLKQAGFFVLQLDQFDRRVDAFNRELQKALTDTSRFERFRDLSVNVRSGVSQIANIAVLHQMQAIADSKGSTLRSVMVQERELPTDEETNLIRAYRDILQGDGGFKINLNDQVRLECSLIENGKRRTISNEEEFRSVSSNGNTALITAMFLMGFVQMIRGPNSPVRLTWVTDEIGRFDASNLGAFLATLDSHHIDVISASPSVDPALARYFSKLCLFDGAGAIFTTETESGNGDAYAQN